MEPSLYNVWQPKNIGIIIISTLLINALLFMGLPQLTRIADRERNTDYEAPHMISARQAPKALEDQRDKKLRRKELKQIPKPKMVSAEQQKTQALKFSFDTSAGGAGGLEIAMMSAEGMNIEMGDFAFSLADVDVPPRAIRTPPAIYPFAAKRQGLRGRIIVSIRIGADGIPTNIKAKRAEPPEVLEAFAEAAEKAVAKYRFQPAKLGGEAVPVRALQPIVFNLD